MDSNTSHRIGPVPEEVSQWLERLAEAAQRDGEASEAALQAITRTLFAQAAMADRLGVLLRNERVGAERIERAVADDTLAGIISGIGAPLRTSFSLADAREAAAELARGNYVGDDAAAALLAAARLVSVFI